MIAKDLPRKNVAYIFTLNLDSYLGDLVPQAKAGDKPKKSHKAFSAMFLAHHQWHGSTRMPKPCPWMSSRTAFPYDYLASNSVLDKLRPDYGSFTNESFPDSAKKDLLGPGLEEKVTKQAEIPKAISKALHKPSNASKKFFQALPFQNSKQSWEGHNSSQGHSYFRGRPLNN